MSQTKNVTAQIIAGTTGFLIQVKGEINCGLLTVEPTFTKTNPQGFNKKILLLDVYPASQDKNGSFRRAEYNENIAAQDTYTDVHLLDPLKNTIEIIPVAQSQTA